MANAAAESDEEVYDVEKVLEKRAVGGGFEYRIRWLGYGPAHDTWEPLSNLQNSKSLVVAFERRAGQGAGSPAASPLPSPSSSDGSAAGPDGGGCGGGGAARKRKQRTQSLPKAETAAGPGSGGDGARKRKRTQSLPKVETDALLGRRVWLTDGRHGTCYEKGYGFFYLREAGGKGSDSDSKLRVRRSQIDMARTLRAGRGAGGGDVDRLRGEPDAGSSSGSGDDLAEVPGARGRAAARVHIRSRQVNAAAVAAPLERVSSVGVMSGPVGAALWRLTPRANELLNGTLRCADLGERNATGRLRPAVGDRPAFEQLYRGGKHRRAAGAAPPAERRVLVHMPESSSAQQVRARFEHLGEIERLDFQSGAMGECSATVTFARPEDCWQACHGALGFAAGKAAPLGAAMRPADLSLVRQDSV